MKNEIFVKKTGRFLNQFLVEREDLGRGRVKCGCFYQDSLGNIISPKLRQKLLEADDWVRLTITIQEE